MTEPSRPPARLKERLRARACSRRPSAPVPPPAARRRVGRVVRGAVYAKAALAFAAIVIVSGCYLRLLAGPVSLHDHAGEVARALEARIGPGWRVDLGDAHLELSGMRPAVRTSGLEIRNPAGAAVVRAPSAVVSLDPWSVLVGSVTPREIELRDLQLRAVVGPDGSLFVSPEGAVAGPSPPASAPVGVAPGRSRVAAAFFSLLDPIVAGDGPVGSLDRASLRSARLTLVGPDGRERAVFDRVDATLERGTGHERRVSLALRGPHGEWRVAGQVGSHGSQQVSSVAVSDIPVADVLLLSGHSGLPVTTDATLSGTIETVSKGERLFSLKGQLRSSSGAISRPGRPPIALDRLVLTAGWDEAARVLRVGELSFASAGTSVRLEGDVLAAAEGGWQARLAGRNAIVAGIDARDAPFTVAEVALDLDLSSSALTVRRAALAGDGLDLGATGEIRFGAAGGTSGGGVLEGRGTDVRKLVRLWPDQLNPGLRTFLAERLRAGTVDRLRFRSDLDAADFRAAFSDEPLTDRALQLDFAASGVELDVVDGLPPLRRLVVTGSGSGTRSAISARDGEIGLPDGKRLRFDEASFTHENLDKPNTPALIGFRVTGGADALASLLRSPAIRGAVDVPVDPANVRGTVDVRARLPLVPGRIPPLSQLALSLKGTLSDLSVDGLPGREKLEGGAFAVEYDAGALSLKGEGRLGGTPASFSLAASRTGPGELTVAAVLDEAARARRSLPVAPQISGPVPVKVSVPLTGRTGARVEADLSRAAIDGLVPGWTKPAGRPGRLTFTAGDGEALELRDLSLDAGPTQLRGHVTLASNGSVERADLSTFRLSTGDDLRAQAERTAGGYRVTVRGNNADARPILRWATNGPPKAGGKEKDELDLDLSINILTGHNEEALTNVTAKLAARGGDLRSVQFAGRFRNAPVEVALGKRDAGSPILSVRSGDAGATLRFLDLYRRMTGGRLALDARSADGVQEGSVTVEDFGLKGEPALSVIAAKSVQFQSGAAEERGLAPVARSEVDQVLFLKLTTDFRRVGSRVDYADAVIYGPQAGFNLSGYVDHGRDRLDILGTFVPAYALNSALNQLPVVGLFLGGRNEGLFALDFRVTGAISRPTVTVNPLSAVAPGILRKLFGWMLPGGEPAAPARPGGEAAAAPSPPARRSAR